MTMKKMLLMLVVVLGLLALLLATGQGEPFPVISGWPF